MHSVKNPFYSSIPPRTSHPHPTCSAPPPPLLSSPHPSAPPPLPLPEDLLPRKLTLQQLSYHTFLREVLLGRVSWTTSEEPRDGAFTMLHVGRRRGSLSSSSQAPPALSASLHSLLSALHHLHSPPEPTPSRRLLASPHLPASATPLAQYEAGRYVLRQVDMRSGCTPGGLFEAFWRIAGIGACQILSQHPSSPSSCSRGFEGFEYATTLGAR